MIESFLITSRETLEAGLVVGIVLGVLNKENLSHLKKLFPHHVNASVIQWY